eukprot:TRINITY_DN2422_c0_g1_i2.p1 TRINITY_DN2422_c0_g1~~TRINITY_DN2422_c0_g1_i2.p1  ORF type:complete len:690 (-),score=224.48 TRINITY_DN2422_c0_g1_i2:75-2108(-)
MADKQLQPLFRELDGFVKSGDFKDALARTHKILAIAPADTHAVHYKVLCLMQLGRFDDALSAIKSAPKDLNLVFEHAYCCYRTKDHKQAIELVTGSGDLKDQPRMQHLLAQVYYREDRFDEASDIYQSLSTAVAPDNVSVQEIQANRCAALTLSGRVSVALEVSEDWDSGKDATITYEQKYNAACAHIANGDFASALSLLKKARALCLSSLEEEDFSPEEIADEVAVIDTQIAYATQVQGGAAASTVEADYLAVLKRKPSDLAVVAVASNNVVVARRDQHLFDSDKKLQAASSAAHKLPVAARRVILSNRCTLSLKMNKPEQCRAQAADVLRDDSESALPVLVDAALLLREDKRAEASAALSARVASNPKNALPVQLALAQLHLTNPADKEAALRQTIAALSAISSLEHQPATVATLVSLYDGLKNTEGAASVLTAAVQYWEKRAANAGDQESIDVYTRLTMEAASWFLGHAQARKAADLYHQLVRLEPANNEYISRLIVSLSVCDPAQAEKYSDSLPAVDVDVADVDASALEALPASGLKSKTASSSSSSDDTSAPTTSISRKNTKKKKKKKRKIILPKNYDPNVLPDAERWLPRYERSTYKRRKKGGPGRGGAQGNASTNAHVDANSKSATTSSTGAASTTTTAETPAVKEAPKQQQQQSGGGRGRKARGKKGRR